MADLSVTPVATAIKPQPNMSLSDMVNMARAARSAAEVVADAEAEGSILFGLKAPDRVAVRGVELRSAHIHDRLTELLHVGEGFLPLVVLGVFLNHHLRCRGQSEPMGDDFQREGLALLRLKSEPVAVVGGGELSGDGGGQGNFLRLLTGVVWLGFGRNWRIGEGQQRGVREVAIGTLHAILEAIQTGGGIAECAGGETLASDGIARSGNVHCQLVKQLAPDADFGSRASG